MARGKIGKAHGKVAYRSGLERSIRAGLDDSAIGYEYEPVTFAYTVPETGYLCQKCGQTAIVKKVKYTPDFYIGKRFYVEAKGRFTGVNRRRLLAWRASQPGIDIRLVFQRDNTLSKSSKTKYSEWAKANKFQYHVGSTIPAAWLR